jgi:hypothetical protein
MDGGNIIILLDKNILAILSMTKYMDMEDIISYPVPNIKVIGVVA